LQGYEAGEEKYVLAAGKMMVLERLVAYAERLWA